ncbi:WhiB family transcriptional regulator [Gordonia aichiensis]|uniref:WhiB family transcriptional regulator n=1 Tax=Gordonia aichiensis TaxID=36820 RepID=UPI003262E75B
MTVAYAPTVSSRSGSYPDLPSEPIGWRDEGHCTRSALEFNPAIEVGGRVQPTTAQQRAQCVGCPVARWCALDALKRAAEYGSIDGVWAGQAGTVTMRGEAFNTLIANLGRIAGLPDDHYLLRTNRIDRRRAHIGTLYECGVNPEQIANRLNLSVVTVERDLTALCATDLR